MQMGHEGSRGLGGVARQSVGRVGAKAIAQPMAVGPVAGGAVVLLGGLLGTNAIALIGFVLAVLSFVVMAVGGILAEHPRRSQTSKGGPSSKQNNRPALEKAETTRRLSSPPAADFFPASVTEETTTKLRR